jgi:hypothetical protein
MCNNPPVARTQVERNKAAALEILLRVSSSLQINTASQVHKTTIVTRTEEL